MSIEELQADLASNIVEAKGLTAMSTIGDITNHLNNTLWPFLENLVRETSDVDEAVAAMYEKSEDILQFETGKQLAIVITGANTLIAELEKRAVGDKVVLDAIKDWRARAKEATEVLEEITLPEDYDPDDDEGDEGDEGDDDDDNDVVTPGNDNEPDEDDDDKKGGA
jgi:hypothetical protein